MTGIAASAVTHSATKKTATSKTHNTVHHATLAHRSLVLPPGFHWRINRSTMVFPGSHELLVQQNQELDRSQMFRVTNDIDLIQHEVSQ